MHCCLENNEALKAEKKMLKGYASYSSSNKSPEWNGVEDEEPDDLDKAIIEESKKMKAKNSKQQK